MDTARSGCGETYTELTGELRVTTCHERSGFFVTDLDKSDSVLMRTQRFHDSVNAVAGKPEYDFHAPIDERFNEYVRCVHEKTFLVRSTACEEEMRITGAASTEEGEKRVEIEITINPVSNRRG